MRFLVRTFISWLPLAVAITGICLLVYATVQQNYRQSLNDPQIQMAEDGARALANGALPTSIVPQGEKIDIAKSLSPWIAVYDERGKPLESNAVLDDVPPSPPMGTLDAARNNRGKDTARQDENRVTWQPNEYVRQALVIVYQPEKKQFVVAGRNMREVENRERQLSFFVFVAWVVLLGTTFFVKAFVRYLT